MRADVAILVNPENIKKITIIEGPDGVGKSYLVNKIKERFTDSELDLRLVRCPDDRGGAKIRSVIMSDDLAKNPKALAFLFLADFVYAYDTIIKPELANPKVRFIFDRFLPSTCIYQEIGIEITSGIIKTLYPEMHDVFSKAQYLYLTPGDLEKHKRRLASKKGDEINHLDPVGDTAILKNIEDYHLFSLIHHRHGLLGSYNVEEIHV